MAVVSMMSFSGDPDELAAKMRGIEPAAAELAAKHGGLASITARTADGLLVVNLWEHEDGRHAMAEEPEIQAALRAAGFPEPRFEGYEVVSLRITDALRALP